MDFFKSVFSDDPEPPRSSDSDPSEPNPEPEPEPPGAWSFGGLIRTLAVQSESVIETYRRDLQEFTTGLKKEIEVAQGSLETMIDSTAQIISKGKESILAVDLDAAESDRGSAQIRYSRFDSQVRAVQCDARTYTEEPEDLSDYENWKSGLGDDLDLDSEERIEEMEGLFGENGAMEGVYKRVVPDCVDHETFWCRYFYKVHKLEKNEELRAKLVRRAISSSDHDDEELSWDVDDSDDENDGENQNGEMGEKSPGDDDVRDVNSHVADENVGGSSNGSESSGDSLASGRRLVPEEEAIEWDEIEDLSSIDDDGKRIAATRNSSSSPNRADLRKRLSSAEEDLSWDIEGDDD